MKIKKKVREMLQSNGTPHDRRTIPVLILLIAATVLFLIPFRVVSYGFLPSDDALYHAAKAASGKPWSEILVLRPGVTMDRHPGWHAILGAAQRITGLSVDGLVVFEVVFLFLFFCLAPLFFLERPEAWLLSLLVLALTVPGFIVRLMFGRPYVFTMAVVLVLGFLWPRIRGKTAFLPATIALTTLFALSTWVHCVWYLLLFPVACFFASREYRAGAVAGACVISGALLNAFLTGRPAAFLYETVAHLNHAIFGYATPRMLVHELRPFDGNGLVVCVVLMFLMWRFVRGSWKIGIIYTPVFILAAAGWALGFTAWRFWLDWGAPALGVWMALEFQDWLKEGAPEFSSRRAFIAAAAGAVLFLCFSSNYNDRWTKNLNTEYLSPDNPWHARLLPPSGGIIYSDDETVFYQTFFHNPRAGWRYVLGPEQSMMPEEDLEILKNIYLNFRAPGAFEPWVKKMRPQDRLIIRSAGSLPEIQGLGWNRATRELWVGIKKSHHTAIPAKPDRSLRIE